MVSILLCKRGMIALLRHICCVCHTLFTLLYTLVWLCSMIVALLSQIILYFITYMCARFFVFIYSDALKYKYLVTVLFAHFNVHSFYLRFQIGNRFMIAVKTTIMPDTETTSMEGKDEWPKGRSASIVMAAVLAGISVVLEATYILARGNQKYGVSLMPLYAYEIVLFVSAILAMGVFTSLRRNEKHVGENIKLFSDAYMDCIFDKRIQWGQNMNKKRFSLWTHIPLRMIAICICCFGSICLPLLEIYRNIENMLCCHGETEYIFYHVQFFSEICCVLFCICQLFFLLTFKRKCCKNMLLRLLMSTVIAANFTLFVNVVLSVIKAADTIDVPFLTNTTVINISAINLSEKPVFIKCIGKTNNTADIDQVGEWFFKLSYQFPFEYAVLSLCYIGPLWNVCKTSRPAENLTRQRSFLNTSMENNDESPNGLEDNRSAPSMPLIEEGRSKYKTLIVAALKRTVIFMSAWSFPLSASFFFGIFAYHLYRQVTYINLIKHLMDILVFTNDSSKINPGDAVVQTAYIYIICIVAPVGFMVARKEKIGKKGYNPSDILLLVATTGHLIYITFETVVFTHYIINKMHDSKTVWFYIKLILKYLGVFAEGMIVLISSKMEIRKESVDNGRQLFIKGIITFLGVFNIERWYADNFLPPNIVYYIQFDKNQELYDPKKWLLLTSFLYPFVMTFRMTMAIMCFEICARIKREVLKQTRALENGAA